MCDLEDENVDSLHKKHVFVSDKEIYHVSIIDYLQDWNYNKKYERFFKTVLLRKDPATLSAIEPEQYALRFLHFVQMNVLD